MTKSKAAQPGSSDYTVSTVKMEGSGWSMEIEPIVLNLFKSYLYG